MEDVIEFLEACRDTHVEAADWLHNTPDWREQIAKNPDWYGTEEFHLQCVKEYNEFIERLRN